MSKPNGYSFIRDKDHAIELLDQSQVRVANLESNCYQLKTQLADLNRRLAKAEPKANHFDVLLSAVKDNKLVKAQWDKFMMTLRMTGYDGTKRD